MTLSDERIKYLLRGADLGMVHGDYVPNILEREAMCKEILAARKLRDSINTEFIDNKCIGKHLSAEAIKEYDKTRNKE